MNYHKGTKNMYNFFLNRTTNTNSLTFEQLYSVFDKCTGQVLNKLQSRSKYVGPQPREE